MTPRTRLRPPLRPGCGSGLYYIGNYDEPPGGGEEGRVKHRLVVDNGAFVALCNGREALVAREGAGDLGEEECADCAWVHEALSDVRPLFQYRREQRAHVVARDEDAAWEIVNGLRLDSEDDESDDEGELEEVERRVPTVDEARAALATMRSAEAQAAALRLPELEHGDECPNCGSGTVEVEGDEARCMGECGAAWPNPTPSLAEQLREWARLLSEGGAPVEAVIAGMREVADDLDAWERAS